MEGSVLFKTGTLKGQKTNRWVVTFSLLGLALGVRILLILASKSPHLVERFYSASLYPYIARILGFVSGLIPFSIAEFVLLTIPIFIIFALYIIIRRPRYILSNSKRIFHYTVRLLALGYILFYLLWGFNYFRLDYLSLSHMSKWTTSYHDLKELTSIMIERTNDLREALPEDEKGLLLVEEDIHELGRIANKGFLDYKVGKIDLGEIHGRIKPVFLSKYMSYTGITGIYIPFTSEPTVNTHIPRHNLLSTISHEIAHQKGFAREDEANFIAYKANTSNPDKRFQYSGYYLAMTYLINEVYRENLDDYATLYDSISEEVKRDMSYAREYWKAREGKVKESANKMNDNYLKANYQEDGVRSYNGVVKLLLAEYKSGKN
ncbi:MAG: DUF3810 domain-containing protein [Tissierellaceae bacterium]|jgi:hypothetical protein